MSGAGACAEEIALSPDESIREIDRRMLYRLDDGRTPQEVIAAFKRGDAAQTLRQALKNAADPYQPIWAYVELRNRGPSEIGQDADTWFFAADTYNVLTAEAYIQRGGALVYVLSHAINEPFETTERGFGRLRSEAIEIARGERVVLLARLRLGLIRDAELHLLTPGDLRDDAFATGLAMAAFYAFAASFLLFFLGFHLSLNNRTGVYYAGAFALGLLNIVHIDQLDFRLLYPNKPEARYWVGVVLVNALAAWGFYIGGRSMRAPPPGAAKANPRGRLLERATLAPIAITLAAPFLSPETTLNLTYFVAAAMFGSQIYVTAAWRAQPSGEETATRAGIRGYIFVSASAGIIAIAFYAMHMLERWPRDFQPPEAYKALYLVVGLVGMIVLTAALIDLRLRHHRAIDQRLAALEAEAAEAQARLDAERAYSRARERAQQRERQMAAASHDLRQPLSALRFGMAASAERLGAVERERLNHALDYLDQLAGQYLADTRPDAAAAEPIATPSSKTEPYALALLLSSLREMFSEEAVSKGLRLRIVESSIETDIPPLALMRILSNLVGNAVKYTRSGKVLVGVRRRAGTPEIHVLDTGPGMTPAELRRFADAYAKGDSSDGEGLGLAICHDIAAREGLHLDAVSTPGRGTRFRLVLRKLDDG